MFRFLQYVIQITSLLTIIMVNFKISGFNLEHFKLTLSWIIKITGFCTICLINKPHFCSTRLQRPKGKVITRCPAIEIDLQGQRRTAVVWPFQVNFHNHQITQITVGIDLVGQVVLPADKRLNINACKTKTSLHKYKCGWNKSKFE